MFKKIILYFKSSSFQDAFEWYVYGIPAMLYVLVASITVVLYLVILFRLAFGYGLNFKY